MAMYNLKSITTVPSAKDFYNFVLCKTNRKTPTVIRRNMAISRIRRFYLRKVKFTQQSFHDRIEQILTEFPKLEDMHPFYADLLNTLYNKDHYKLSLGQLNIALRLIDKVAADFSRLMKYGDSLYRCKMLKRAALGRMVTIIKTQAAPLKYLEEVRQHLSRLPSIDPSARTIILCGCPNAGKSSFINLLTRADVEVQPYAFTTKSLYIGHMDYSYLKWQVIDTPGILDRPFDEMNTIELQAITALAHIRAAVIFIMDVSEQCNYSIEDQMKIYDSIKPLFANKPLFVACNKSDIITLDELAEKSPEKKTFIDKIKAGGVPIHQVSTLTREGIIELRNAACDKLLQQRVEAKLLAKSANNYLNRIHVAIPQRRDNKERPPFIPEKVLERKQKKMAEEMGESMQEEEEEKTQKKLEKDIMEELDIDYFLDLNKTKDLENPEWKYDKIPVFIDGHNFADFIDPNIMEKLAALEKEEEERYARGIYNVLPDSLSEREKYYMEVGGKILKEVLMMRAERRDLGSMSSKQPIPRYKMVRNRSRSTTRLREEFTRLGVDMSDTEYAHFATTKPMFRRRVPIRKSRMDQAGEVRSSASKPRDEMGIKDRGLMIKARQKAMGAIQRLRVRGGYTEADRRIENKKPVHLFSGKRGIGKTDRR